MGFYGSNILIKRKDNYDKRKRQNVFCNQKR
jgi:hypothetical protein